MLVSSCPFYQVRVSRDQHAATGYTAPCADVRTSRALQQIHSVLYIFIISSPIRAREVFEDKMVQPLTSQTCASMHQAASSTFPVRVAGTHERYTGAVEKDSKVATYAVGKDQSG